MARAIEDLGFDSLWLGEHLLYRCADRPPRGPWEAWTMLAGARRRHDAGRARAARRLHDLPQPGDARQAGRHGRRDQRRPLRPGPRRRLERDRVPRVRLPVRPPHRPLRGGVHDHPDAAPRRAHRLRRPVLPGARLRAAAARAAAGRPAAHDRLERAADAATSRCRTPTLERVVRRHRQPPGRRPAAARARRRRLPRGRARPGRGRADRRGPRADAGRQRPASRATGTAHAATARRHAGADRRGAARLRRRGHRPRPARPRPDHRAPRSRPSHPCCGLIDAPESRVARYLPYRWRSVAKSRASIPPPCDIESVRGRGTSCCRVPRRRPRDRAVPRRPAAAAPPSRRRRPPRRPRSSRRTRTSATRVTADAVFPAIAEAGLPDAANNAHRWAGSRPGQADQRDLRRLAPGRSASSAPRPRSPSTRWSAGASRRPGRAAGRRSPG